ncbi:hypothetical protein M5E87_15365 [Flavonifractor plautii]|nr:hypothetical protein M5E87_15365 [Flavonifractor plautii]
MSETATKKKEPGMATLVIVLFAICAATALLLGLTNYVTAPLSRLTTRRPPRRPWLPYSPPTAMTRWSTPAATLWCRPSTR